MTWTIPNLLTILRLAAAPCIALVFVVLVRPLADWVALILFVLAALTDYLDGYLARRWDQTSKFGKMLDPIADKAMVMIALAVLIGSGGLAPLILIPVIVIMFREVLVSGLREYLGAEATRMQVTQLSKWKTTVQMVAIPAMFLAGITEINLQLAFHRLDPFVIEQVLAGDAPDELGIKFAVLQFKVISWMALGLIWVAALLTAITGWDYFRKALPYLREEG